MKSIFHQDGILIDKETIALVNGFNEAPDADRSQLAVLIDRTWIQVEIKTDSLISLSKTDNILYAVGRNGLFLRLSLPLAKNRAGLVASTSMDVIKDAHKFGELTRSRTVGQSTFVVGQCGQVYLLNNNEWRDYSFGLRSDAGPDLEDVGGISESSLYTCGIGGEIFRLQDQIWQKLPSPTNLNLSSLYTENDQSVYFCGDSGILIHFKDEAWHMFTGDPDRNYWDIHKFHDNIVLTHSGGIDVFDGITFRALHPSPSSDNTFYRLSGNGEILLSVGPDDIFLIDCTTVTPVPVPGRS